MSCLGKINTNMDATSVKSRQKKSVTHEIIIEIVEGLKLPQREQIVPADQKYEYNCPFSILMYNVLYFKLMGPE